MPFCSFFDCVLSWANFHDNLRNLVVFERLAGQVGPGASKNALINFHAMVRCNQGPFVFPPCNLGVKRSPLSFVKIWRVGHDKVKMLVFYRVKQVAQQKGYVGDGIECLIFLSKRNRLWIDINTYDRCPWQGPSNFKSKSGDNIKKKTNARMCLKCHLPGTY